MKAESPQVLRQHLLNRSGVREMIARRAYEIYEQRGQVQGHDKDDWLRAEIEILNRLMEEAIGEGQNSGSRTGEAKPSLQPKNSRKSAKKAATPRKLTREETTQEPVAAANVPVAEESSKKAASNLRKAAPTRDVQRAADGRRSDVRPESTQLEDASKHQPRKVATPAKEKASPRALQKPPSDPT